MGLQIDRAARASQGRTKGAGWHRILRAMSSAALLPCSNGLPVPRDGASGGVGVEIFVTNKFSLSFGAAKVCGRPKTLNAANRGVPTTSVYPKKGELSFVGVFFFLPLLPARLLR